MLPRHKTRIVATMGPASDDPAILDQMLLAGLDVARLNFSHGAVEDHARRIEALRAAARRTDRRLALMADLPGPKIRLGKVKDEPYVVHPGDTLVLTSEETAGDRGRVTVSLGRLHELVQPGERVYVNDGIVGLEVERVEGVDVVCRVLQGGELRSRKGVNLPGTDLGISAFTAHDRELLAFALDHGVDLVSQSFVESEDDLHALKEAARELAGRVPFVVAKIERARALDRLDRILDAADGIMVARGDLGVEIPVERIANVQKDIVRRANLRGRPVIIATHMLESMTTNPRPTRAEATDVANAVLDGADAVMLSGESAVGLYPVEAVRMLGRIAVEVEPRLEERRSSDLLGELVGHHAGGVRDLLALSVETVVEHAKPDVVLVPTRSGATARNVARFRLPTWIAAVSRHGDTCQGLQLSWGVVPIHVDEEPEDWRGFARAWLLAQGLDARLAVLLRGPSKRNPHVNHRMEILDLA